MRSRRLKRQSSLANRVTQSIALLPCRWPVTDPEDSAPSAESSSADQTNHFDWLTEFPIANQAAVRASVERFESLSLPADLVGELGELLRGELGSLGVIDGVFDALVRFIEASLSPTGVVALFCRDTESLSNLVRVFATSDVLTDCLIADPAAFDLLRVSDGQPTSREYLVDELSANLAVVKEIPRAAQTVREFATREMIRVAFGEFIRDMLPEVAARQLACIADAIVQASLDFAIRYQTKKTGEIQRVDGTSPVFSVIGLGGLGSEELTYGDNLDLIVLCDQIDRKNASHVAFYRGVAGVLMEVLRSRETLFFQANMIRQPRIDPDDSIVSLFEAINVCESSNEIWMRLAYVRARYVAGDRVIFNQFHDQLQPWIYRRFLTSNDLTEFRSLRGRVMRRLDRTDSEDSVSSPGHASIGLRDIATDPGSRNDIRLTVRFLQLLHGGEVTEVRLHRTQDALDALEHSGCITHQEATLLTAHYAKLTRLEHQLSIIAGTRQTELPESSAARQRLAWQLGMRDPETGFGDDVRFMESLENILSVNRRIIGHLVSEPDAGHPTDMSLSRDAGADDVPIETELLLDPSPDPVIVAEVLGRYGFDDNQERGISRRVIQDLDSLATETSSFLSTRRCRHFFAALVPDLLTEIARTPHPLEALERLVAVANSIGAKSTLWELLATNRPTLELLVRLCAGSPYLSDVLVGNPGMIDELVDSLVIDRVPSAEKLDAQSMMLCRNAKDLEKILRSFKDASHLTAGVHQILAKEDVQRIHALLSDTADSAIRRVIEFEQEGLAQRFGDPTAKDGKTPAELVALAFGRLGGREKNYHSDLDVLFLYTSEGKTERRVGGPRATTSNDHFFNELTRQVIDHVNHVTESGRLYDLDSRLRPTDEEEILSVTIETFARRFRQGVAPLWQRMAICKARPISGHRDTRAEVAATIADLLRNTTWRDSMVDEVQKIRQRMDRSAGPDNLKRGRGGAMDVEMLTQLMTLRYAGESDDDRLGGPARLTATLDVLGVLADDERIPRSDAERLASNYRILRTVEANLRLMNAPSRHGFPKDAATLECLAFLMNMSPDDIIADTNQARDSNREVFDRLLAKI